MLKEDDKDGLEAHPGFERRLGNHIDIFQKKKSFSAFAYQGCPVGPTTKAANLKFT